MTNTTVKAVAKRLADSVVVKTYKVGETYTNKNGVEIEVLEVTSTSVTLRNDVGHIFKKPLDTWEKAKEAKRTSLYFKMDKYPNLKGLILQVLKEF